MDEHGAVILPVFFYNQLQRPGDEITLHLFEQRYRILVARAISRGRAGDRAEFVFLPNFADYHCARGDVGLVVSIVRSAVQADGRANIRGVMTRYVLLSAHWEEESTQGLHYCRALPLPSAYHPEALQPHVEHLAWALQQSAELLGGEESDHGSSCGGGHAWMVQPITILPFPVPAGYPSQGLGVYSSCEIAERAAVVLGMAQALAVGLPPAPPLAGVLPAGTALVLLDRRGIVARHAMGWSPIAAGAFPLVVPRRTAQERIEGTTNAQVQVVRRTPEAHVLLRGTLNAVRSAAEALGALVSATNRSAAGAATATTLPHCHSWVAEVMTPEEASLVPLDGVLLRLWDLAYGTEAEAACVVAAGPVIAGGSYGDARARYQKEALAAGYEIEEAPPPPPPTARDGGAAYWAMVRRLVAEGRLVVQSVRGQNVGRRRVHSVAEHHPSVPASTLAMAKQGSEWRAPTVLEHLCHHYKADLGADTCAHQALHMVLHLEAEESCLVTIPHNDWACVSRASAKELLRVESLRVNQPRLRQLLIAQRQQGCGFQRLAAEQVSAIVEYLVFSDSASEGAWPWSSSTVHSGTDGY